MILYINSTVRAESRTDRIARALLRKIAGDDQIKEIGLVDEDLKPLDKERLELRSRLIEKRDFSHSIFNYAKDFANADIIVISAPYWDFSFPSLLKIYIENIYVTGIVSEYGADGKPNGLCRCKNLYYVTTAGGEYTPDYSFDYIRALATQHFGIENVSLIKAEMLDVVGFDSEKIVADTIKSLEEYK